MRPADVAARTLDLVRAAAGPAAEAEVAVDRRRTALTRFAASAVHQNVADDTTTVRLQLHLGGRTTIVQGTATGAAGLRALVDDAVATAAAAPVDATWPGLARPGPPSGGRTARRSAEDDDPVARAGQVRAFVAALDGLPGAGFCSTRHHTAAYANTAGRFVAGTDTQATLDGVARCGTAEGVARASSSSLAGLDGARLGARAAAKARAGTDPVDLAPGRYQVVLEPTAVADVLWLLGYFGFDGRAYTRGSSFAEPGARQFDPAITIVDDPVGPDSLGLPFDVEGTGRRRLDLVTAGVTRGVVHNRRTARSAGADATGHADTDIPLSGGVATAHLHLLPAGPRCAAVPEVDGPAADAAVADLVGAVTDGLLVTDHFYTRALDPRAVVVTGLTRNGLWRIEGGRVTAPVRNLRFTQSYLRALAPGAVLGVGRHAVDVPAGLTAVVRAPALHLAEWNYTGGSDG
ncbi:metallopeptidase TldD-related protein [Jidongwangia harbinensis]|uniref:metallopeptidase TldD-related protein n=1 Tax=Jidongwangia harbinensis TaxID=2878561 RepID=UPI001CD94491|nr:metallopeptidase TldD-related protein [Jidongwangia harbinensis]MCA2211825.1 TldD/PmbA family protein [Jidongwangia harbinensis]